MCGAASPFQARRFIFREAMPRLSGFGKLHCQSMVIGIPANPIELEISGPATIHFRDYIEYLISMIINRTQRWPRVTRNEEFEWLRRIAHAFIRINLRAFR